MANPRIQLWAVRLLAAIFAALAAFLYIEKVTNRKGVVTGILYIMEDSSATLDGQIVKNGDIVNGVRVVSIEKSVVEFEKDGARWKQAVNEKPNLAWSHHSRSQAE